MAQTTETMTDGTRLTRIDHLDESLSDDTAAQVLARSGVDHANRLADPAAIGGDELGTDFDVAAHRDHGDAIAGLDGAAFRDVAGEHDRARGNRPQRAGAADLFDRRHRPERHA